MKKLYLFLLLGMFMISFASATLWDDITLEAYYKLDNSTGVVYDMVNTYDGTAYNLTRGVSGKIGSAFSFDGENDYFESSTGITGNDFSVSAWINYQNSSSDNMVYSPQNIASWSGIFLRVQNGIPKFQVGDGLISFVMTESPDALIINQWYHIVGTYSVGGNASLYIDGVLKDTLAVNSIGTSTDSRIGADHNIDGDFDGKIDEVGIWNKSLNQTDIIELYNDGIGLTFGGNSQNIRVNLNSPTNDSLLSSSINFSVTSYLPIALNYNFTNITYDIWYSNGTLFNETTIPLSGDLTNTSIINFGNFITGDYIWNALTCGNNVTKTIYNYSTSNYTFSWIPFSINDQLWNNNTLEGSLEDFSIELTLENTSTFQLATFNYDGIDYNGNIEDLGGGIFNISRQIAIPSVSSQTNKTFFWKFTLGSGFKINTSSLNQTVDTFLIDDCSSYTNKLLNFTMLNESNFNPMKGTIELNINVYTTQTTTLIGSYSKNINYNIGDNALVCLQNIGGDYSMSYEVKHYSNETNSTYFKKYRNIQKMAINSDTPIQNIPLYNLKINDGKAFKIIVVGNLFGASGNSDLLIEVQRKYSSLNKFILVESPITSSEGEAIANLVTLDEIYNFVISYNGLTLGTFNNYQVQCSNPAIGQCTIILNLGQSSGTIENFDNYGNISQTFLLDKINNILYQTFSSTNGLIHEVNSLIVKDDGYLTNVLCNETITGTSGTFICNIPTSYKNESFYIQTTVDGTYIGSKFFSQGVEIDWFGADIFIELLMFSSLVLLFIAHPITIVIGAVIGITMPILFLYLGQGSFGSIFASILFYIVAGIIIILQMRRKL